MIKKLLEFFIIFHLSATYQFSGKAIRGGFLRPRKSENIGSGLLRRELSILSSGERGCSKIALSRIFATVTCPLSGAGRRSSLVAFDLRGSVR